MKCVGRNEPCLCGSGKKYKKCCGSIHSGSEVLHTVQSVGFRVAQDFQDPGKLYHFGPVIKGGWHLSPEDEERLRLGGLPIPERVAGYLLIDTGATKTAIDEDVARELNLNPVAQDYVTGVSGAGLHNFYKAAVFLELGDVHGDKVAMSLFKDQFAAVRQLRANYDRAKLVAPNGTPLRVIGLLGRDFLQFTQLHYDGLKGNWRMEVDPRVLKPWEGF